MLLTYCPVRGLALADTLSGVMRRWWTPCQIEVPVFVHSFRGSQPRGPNDCWETFEHRSCRQERCARSGSEACSNSHGELQEATASCSLWPAASRFAPFGLHSQSFQINEHLLLFFGGASHSWTAALCYGGGQRFLTSRDLWAMHPFMEEAWALIARHLGLETVVTFSNAEKRLLLSRKPVKTFVFLFISKIQKLFQVVVSKSLFFVDRIECALEVVLFLRKGHSDKNEKHGKCEFDCRSFVCNRHHSNFTPVRCCSKPGLWRKAKEHVRTNIGKSLKGTWNLSKQSTVPKREDLIMTKSCSCCE